MPLTQLLPEDIGAAAAYEAYRTWKYNSFLHEPLSAEREAQREGLTGMAIAESTYVRSCSYGEVLTRERCSSASLAILTTSLRHLRPQSCVRGRRIHGISPG